MKCSILLAILLLAVMPLTHTRAQDGGDNLPPVLNPADFFTDAVEIIETLPVVNVDNETRTLYYFDPTAMQWTAYPYPAELAEVEDVVNRSDGTYFVGKERFYIYTTPEDGFIFDPARGRFSRPSGACGTVQDAPGDGQWTLFQQVDDAAWYLCFTETGKLEGPLPADLELCDSYQRIPASVDRDWIVFADCKIEPLPYSIYAYQRSTGTLNFLGTGASEWNETVKIERWADATRPIIVNSDMRNPTLVSYFMADVTQPHSLTPMFDGLRYSHTWGWVNYYDDPPRYEWLPGEFEPIMFNQELRTCALHAYDLTTAQETVYPASPGICGSGTPITGPEDRLIRSLRVEGDQQLTGVLMRFNPYTGEATELFSGEIEYIDSVTPDSQYAILTMDSSGSVTPASAITDDPYWFGDQLEAPRQVIFDLTTNQIVYELPAKWAVTGGRITPGIDQISGSVFLLWDEKLESEFPQFSNRLLRLEDDQAVITAIPDVKVVLPNALLVEDESGVISILDIPTGTMRPAIFPPNQTELTITRQANGLLLVNVSADNTELGRYLIRTPNQ